MIYRSFLRKKITYLYLIILTILTTTIIILNNFSSKIIDEQNNIYEKNAYLVITSSKDYKNELKKNKFISKIDKLLLFEPNYENNTIISKENKEDTILWNYLCNYDYSGDIVMVSYSDQLNGYDVNLGLEPYNYNGLFRKDFYLNQQVVFNFNNKEITLKVNKLYDAGDNPGITISKELFDKLYAEETNKTISVVVDRESKASEIIREIRKDKDSKVTRIWSVKEEDSKLITRLGETLNVLKIANYILITILLILLIIINKNILEDCQKNFTLEKKLGFNYLTIRLNAFKRLAVLHSLCVCISLILSLAITKIINLEFKLNITLFLILIVTLLIDSLLCLFLKISK